VAIQRVNKQAARVKPGGHRWQKTKGVVGMRIDAREDGPIINVTEKEVFFALCKAIRKKQNENLKVAEGSAVDSSGVVYYLSRELASNEHINEKQVWALLHKMIEKGLVNKKQVMKRKKWRSWRGKHHSAMRECVFFELGAKGKKYIEALKEVKP